MDHGRSLAPPRFDAYAPAEIANRVESAGLAKVRQKPLTTFTLAVLAGAYVSFGVVSYTIVVTESALHPLWSSIWLPLRHSAHPRHRTARLRAE